MGKFESIGTIQPFLKLHEGEWADVYKAYDLALGKNVLLKKLKSIFEHDAEIAERFEAEAMLMAQIQHPNVVSVLSSGRAGSAVYFTAEFVEGKSLSDLLEEGALHPIVATFLLVEITKGLAAAHEKNIFHRDIKPSNIVVADSGAVKLTDFGMASILEADNDKELRGTLGYIAPELLFEGVPGAETDIFALGVTFYEMLSGKASFRGESSREVFDSVLHYDPIPLLESNPSINPALIHVCRMALDKKPSQRYPSCKHLLLELEAILKDVSDAAVKEEIIRYVANPAEYEPEIKEPFRHTAQPLSRTTQLSTLPNELGSKSRFRWILPVCLVGIVALAFMWSLVKKSEDVEVAEVPTPRLIASTPDVNIVPGDSLVADTMVLVDTLVTATRPPVNSIDYPTGTAEPDTGEDERTSTAEDSLPTLTLMAEPELSSENGAVEVQCTPFCTVYIDDDSIGTAPPMLTMELPKGVHRLELKHPILPTYATELVVEAGKKEDIKIALRDYVGTVELSINPWARVYINDVFKGDVPPSQSFPLRPGKHVLRLEHDLGIWTDTLLVIAGERRTYKYNLTDLLQRKF